MKKKNIQNSEILPLKEDVTLFFDVVNKKISNAGRNKIIFGKYWLEV